VFFFLILIYIEKEGMMKISRNRVPCYFNLGFLIGVFGGVVKGVFCYLGQPRIYIVT